MYRLVAIWYTARREWFISKNQRLWLVPTATALILLVIPAMALSPNTEVLQSIAAVQVSLALLLSMLTYAERLYLTSLQQGTLEQQLRVSVTQGWARGIEVCAIRVFIWWLQVGLPVSVLGCFALLGYGLSAQAFWAGILCFPTLTLALAALGSFSSSLALAKGGLLIILIGLPPAIPLLVTGINCIQMAEAGKAWGTTYFVMASFSFLLSVGVLVPTAFALRIQCAEN